MSPVPQPPRSLADEALADPAMDQALTWLIELDDSNPEQQASFQAWLHADPANRQAFAKAQAIWNSQPVRQAAVLLAQPAAPSAAPPAVQPGPLPTCRRLRGRWKPLAMAAVVLLGLFNFSNLSVRLQADHLTSVGERQRLQLADGSRVLLNTHSAFTGQPAGRQRGARLYQGEAYFEVPLEPGRPLEVEAGPIRMQANSTDFSVRYLDGVAQVKVQRGAVDVRAVHGDASIRLDAGESLEVSQAGFGDREKLDPAKDLAWVQGRLVLDNCPLGDALDELRRYYPGLIINTNSALDRIRVTGNYRLEHPLDVVRSLARIASANVRELPMLVILD